MLHDRHRDESGVALVFALLAVLIIASLATIAFQRSVAEVRATGFERNYEAAIHVAEAGLDGTIAEINFDQAYLTTDPGGAPHEYTLGATATNDQERAWAVAIAEDAAGCPLVSISGGEVCSIRPFVDRDGNGSHTAGADEELDLVFSVAFFPSRDAEDRRLRVVKIEFDRGFFTLNDAVRTHGCLTVVGSNVEVGGLNGNVHTNGCLTLSGTPTIEGTLTYSGPVGTHTYKRPDGSTATADQVPEKPLPSTDALETYREHAADNAASWYDLCPDGTVRSPDTSGLTATPCSQGLVTGFTLGDSWRGWKFQAGEWRLNTAVTAVTGSGIYYVHHNNAVVNGNVGGTGPVPLTIIASAVTKCAGTGGASGNVVVSGTPRMTGMLTAAGGARILALADRDLNMGGTPGTQFEGVAVAHEQLELSGNVTYLGSVVANDECHTSGSPVSANKIGGSVSIVSNAAGALGDDEIVRVTAWNEL